MGIKLRSPFVVTRKSVNLMTPVRLNDGSYFFTYSPEQFGIQTGIYDTNTVTGQMRAYSRCAPVNSVINKQAGCIKTGKYLLIDKKGNEAKAPNKYIAKFLDRPNPLQSFNQFISQGYAYAKIHGIAYAVPVYALLNSREIQSIYFVPNFMVTPVYSGKVFQQTEINQIITGYRIDGLSKVFMPDDLMIFRDSSVSNSDVANQFLQPQSRLIPLSDQVNSVIATTDSWLTISKRKGIPLGIISSGAKDSTSSIPLTPEEKAEAQSELNTFGMSEKLKKFVVSSASLNFTQISLPVKDLLLLEGMEANSRHICNGFDYPFDLMGYANNAALANGGEKKEAEKGHYTNVIIPDAEEICRTINEWFGLTDISLKVFFDHLEIFQKGKKEAADSINIMVRGLDIAFKTKVITKEEYRMQLSMFMDIDPVIINGNTYYDGQATGIPPDTTGQGTN